MIKIDEIRRAQRNNDSVELHYVQHPMNSGLVALIFGFIFSFTCKSFSHFSLSTLVRL